MPTTRSGSHLELRTRQLVADGMSPDEARAEARRFGGVDETRILLRQLNERRDLRAPAEMDRRLRAGCSLCVPHAST